MISLEMVNAVAAGWAGHMAAALADSALILLVATAIWWLARQRASAPFGCWLFLLVAVRLLVPIELTVPSWVAPLSPKQLLNNTADRILPHTGNTHPRDATPGLHIYRPEPRGEHSGAPLAYQPPDPGWPRLAGVTAAGPQGHALGATVEGPDKAAAPESSATILSPSLTPQALLMLGWLAVVPAMLARLAAAHTRCRRLVRSGVLLDAADLPVNLRVLARAAGLEHAPPVIVAPVASPAVCGILRPRLLVPPDLMNFAPRQVAWILLHELAHIRRRDMLMALVQQLLQAVYFFNPAVWLASWAVDQLREYACDDEALAACGGSRRDCGEGFLNVALRASGQPATVALSASLLSRSGFIRNRLVRILDGKRKVRAGLSAGAAAVLVALAAVMIPTVHASKAGPDVAHQAQVPEVAGTQSPAGTNAGAAQSNELIGTTPAETSHDSSSQLPAADDLFVPAAGETARSLQASQLNAEHGPLYWNTLTERGAEGRFFLARDLRATSMEGEELSTPEQNEEVPAVAPPGWRIGPAVAVGWTLPRAQPFAFCKGRGDADETSPREFAAGSTRSGGGFENRVGETKGSIATYKQCDQGDPMAKVDLGDSPMDCFADFP